MSYDYHMVLKVSPPFESREDALEALASFSSWLRAEDKAPVMALTTAIMVCDLPLCMAREVQHRLAVLPWESDDTFVVAIIESDESTEVLQFYPRPFS